MNKLAAQYFSYLASKFLQIPIFLHTKNFQRNLYECWKFVWKILMTKVEMSFRHTASKREPLF